LFHSQEVCVCFAAAAAYDAKPEEHLPDVVRGADGEGPLQRHGGQVDKLRFGLQLLGNGQKLQPKLPAKNSSMKEQRREGAERDKPVSRVRNVRSDKEKEGDARTGRRREASQEGGRSCYDT